MQFISTRGNETVSPAEAILRVFPKAGGLFVPETFPSLTEELLEKLKKGDYAERVAYVLQLYFPEFGEEFLLKACKDAYAPFEGNDPVPLVRVDEGRYILELYHGNTAAQEDVSMNLLPALLKKSAEMEKEKRKLLFLLATNGDAGKSAMEAFKDEKNASVAVFYPDETIEKFQQFALTVQDGGNVFVGGVKGNYEDCKKAVAQARSELSSALDKKGVLLSTLSSQNVARIVPQIAYYISAYLDLCSFSQIEYGDPLDFAVPVGDADNLLAGFYAKKMGLPIGKLICSTNRNKAFSLLIAKGELDADKGYYRTMSPSLDVSNPTEIERFLFELSGRDQKKTEAAMKRFEEGGKIELEREFPHADFYASFASEDDTVDEMYDIFDEYGYPMDTHTGVAAAVYRKYLDRRDEKDKTPVVILAVENPYKCPQDVLYALSGNDVKDSYKGMKRLNLLTAMKPPKCLLAMRYRPIRFQKTALQKDGVVKETLALANGEITPVPEK